LPDSDTNICSSPLSLQNSCEFLLQSSNQIDFFWNGDGKAWKEDLGLLAARTLIPGTVLVMWISTVVRLFGCFYFSGFGGLSGGGG